MRFVPTPRYCPSVRKAVTKRCASAWSSKHQSCAMACFHSLGSPFFPVHVTRRRHTTCLLECDCGLLRKRFPPPHGNKNMDVVGHLTVLGVSVRKQGCRSPLAPGFAHGCLPTPPWMVSPTRRAPSPPPHARTAGGKWQRNEVHFTVVRFGVHPRQLCGGRVCFAHGTFHVGVRVVFRRRYRFEAITRTGGLHANQLHEALLG